LSEGEALALADRVSGADGAAGTGQDLIEELIASKLIVKLQSIGGDVRIRSRFAEMMRLLVANRQLFPNKPWQGAPPLVADFRVDRRPRRFPRRDHLSSNILAEHGSAIAPSALARDLWEALTSPPRVKLAA